MENAKVLERSLDSHEIGCLVLHRVRLARKVLSLE
jgi:hypothetical protein